MNELSFFIQLTGVVCWTYLATFTACEGIKCISVVATFMLAVQYTILAMYVL